MKKFIYSILAILCSLTATMAFTACSNDDDEPSAVNNQINELKSWLNIDEKGECAYPCNDEGVYFVGADSESDASKIAKNLSLGASETGSLTLPDDLGTIKVTKPTDPNGFYFEINYNVKGISVKKLVIINNEVLENGGENMSLPYAIHLFKCTRCGFKMSISPRTKAPSKCPKCGFGK